MDRYEPLRQQQTNGANYDVFTDDIINRLQEWEKRCEFEIVEVAHDAVTLEFKTLPENLDAFADEIYEFCPDVIDQHFGCFEELADAMEEMGEEMTPELEQLIEGIDFEDENSGMELLKRSLRQNKALQLWWD